MIPYNTCCPDFTCPKCGQGYEEDCDSFQPGDNKITCYICNKKFSVFKKTTYTYTVFVKKDKELKEVTTRKVTFP